MMDRLLGDWWATKLSEESWPHVVACEDMVSDFLEWGNIKSYSARGMATLMGEFLISACPHGWPRRFRASTDGGAPRYHYEFPSLRNYMSNVARGAEKPVTSERLARWWEERLLADEWVEKTPCEEVYRLFRQHSHSAVGRFLSGMCPGVFPLVRNNRDICGDEVKNYVFPSRGVCVEHYNESHHYRIKDSFEKLMQWWGSRLDGDTWVDTLTFESLIDEVERTVFRCVLKISRRSVVVALGKFLRRVCPDEFQPVRDGEYILLPSHGICARYRDDGLGEKSEGDRSLDRVTKINKYERRDVELYKKTRLQKDLLDHKISMLQDGVEHRKIPLMEKSMLLGVKLSKLERRVRGYEMERRNLEQRWLRRNL